nr:MAG TPA: hypothetical protein [Caudoviricetes sp.]
MLSRDKREEYDKMASDVASGRAGYQSAVKCRLSKSPKKCYGKPPESLQ